MSREGILELKRRSVVKSLLWRIIGIIWTWVGAYFILSLTPQKYKTAALMSTAIVVYHHSTRMIMYYFYERLWNQVSWARFDANCCRIVPMSAKSKIIWIIASLTIIAFIAFLIFYIQPMIKK